MSLMTAAFAETPVEKDPTYAIILTLFCGVVQLVMGVLHLGNNIFCLYWLIIWMSRLWVLLTRDMDTFCPYGLYTIF